MTVGEKGRMGKCYMEKCLASQKAMKKPLQHPSGRMISFAQVVIYGIIAEQIKKLRQISLCAFPVNLTKKIVKLTEIYYSV